MKKALREIKEGNVIYQTTRLTNLFWGLMLLFMSFV